MSKTTGKRGFIPAQPAAAISALDFAAASETFAAARALDGKANTEAETAQIADLIAERADRLIGIPTTQPAQIAEKVNAFLWLHGCTDGDLSDTATQHRIAASQNEPAKCLLAIYLDLTSHGRAAQQQRAEWLRVVGLWEAALEELQAASKTPCADDDPVWTGAFDAYSDAWQLIVDTPAPDAAATAFKLRVIINHGWEEELTDTPDGPAFYQRLLNERAQDSAFPYVRLLQDACRQSGVDHPALHLQRQS